MRCFVFLLYEVVDLPYDSPDQIVVVRDALFDSVPTKEVGTALRVTFLPFLSQRVIARDERR